MSGDEKVCACWRGIRKQASDDFSIPTGGYTRKRPQSQVLQRLRALRGIALVLLLALVWVACDPIPTNESPPQEALSDGAVEDHSAEIEPRSETPAKESTQDATEDLSPDASVHDTEPAEPPIAPEPSEKIPSDASPDHIDVDVLPESSEPDGVAEQTAQDAIPDAPPTEAAPPEQPPQGKLWFVSPQGSDTQGDGSLGRPFASLEWAASKAVGGDAIYLRGGTYRAFKQRIRKKASATAPLIFSVYPGEQVLCTSQGADFSDGRHVFEVDQSAHLIFRGEGRWIIDGQQTTLQSKRSLVNLSTSEYIDFEGFEIRHSNDRGLSFYQSKHLRIAQNNVHHTYNRALGGSGDHILIEKNHVSHASLINENRKMCSGNTCAGGWPAAVSTIFWWDTGAWSKDIKFRENLVHDVWGEGIDALYLDGGEIVGNTVYNAFSVNIYLDKARHILVDRNHLYSTDPAYYRADKPHPANGISFSVEAATPQSTLPTEEITISNNLIYGTGRGITYWHDAANKHPQNSYRAISILHNVILDTYAEPLYIAEVAPKQAGHLLPSLGLVANNILAKGRVISQHYILGDPTAWRFSNNNWIGGLPTDPVVSHPNSHAQPPLWLSNQHFAGASPTSFRLQPTSPNRGAGLPSSVTSDFWGTPRSRTSPTIGIHEVP